MSVMDPTRYLNPAKYRGVKSSNPNLIITQELLHRTVTNTACNKYLRYSRENVISIISAQVSVLRLEENSSY